jgi:hypothetical protein
LAARASELVARSHESAQGEKHVSRKLVNAICRKFPSAEVSDPWGGGHDAWKEGRRQDVRLHRRRHAGHLGQDRHTIETAQMLIDRRRRRREGALLLSLMGKPALGHSEDELRHPLTASYRLVRSSLTKKAQAELDPFEPTAPPHSPIGPQDRKPPSK